ncbi:MAG: glucuronate isomerase [Spirochaeta sp.]
MKDFLSSDFLLHGKTALRLYHEYAADMPIFDYHNHLVPQEIFERRRFENISQVWLGGDHYKWRAMRAVGVDEHYITGAAGDYEKFEKWAYTLAKLPGNALYHWTHLELQRYFDIHEPLSPATAGDIWDRCNRKLAEPGFDAVGLLERMQVRALCTTDEPSDSLEWHLRIQQDEQIRMQVLPTFRPDRLLHIEDDGFAHAVQLLGNRYDTDIQNLDDLKQTLGLALDFFNSAGCLLADHGFIRFTYGQGPGAARALEKTLQGNALTAEDIADYKGEILRFLGEEYSRRNMGMQLHLGAIRNNNTRMLQELGPNTGYDSVGPRTDPFLLSAFLDDLNTAGRLPRTVLYCLNANDNTVLSTMAVNFASSEVPGKVQLGSAWWFEDHTRGIMRQIDELIETGLISTSVGMLTDSRSLTSFVRHEYYRRILCSRLGRIVDEGGYPADFDALGEMIKDICYRNAVRYFRLNEK